MIYREHIEKRVMEFCEKNGINTRMPIRDAEVKESIRQFIANQVKTDKCSGKEREFERKIKINTSLSSVMGSKETSIEQHFYKALIKSRLDKYFIPQYEEDPYIIDFASPEFMIGVECDGKDFHTSEKQVARDHRRDKFLSSKGWKMIRIEGAAIVRTPQFCIEKIKKIMGVK